ncbi:MAG: FG-GAP repeat domain-containing protein, partial [Planctomycetota bacterium]
MLSIRRSLLVLPFAALLAGSPAAQEEAAVFDAAVVVTDNVHRFERLLDLDADGDQDAVGFWWAFGGYEDITVTGWLNDGNGELVETWSFVISFGSVQSSSPRDLEVGRLDADLRDDFAISFGDRVWLYRSNGAVAPSLYASWTHPTEIESILLADFNVDGLDDLAVHASPSVELLRNQGLGQRLLSTDVIPVLAAAEELRPVDANGDSRPDLFLADKTRVEMY